MVHFDFTWTAIEMVHSVLVTYVESNKWESHQILEIQNNLEMQVLLVEVQGEWVNLSGITPLFVVENAKEISEVFHTIYAK